MKPFLAQQRILVLGANSDVAQALCHEFARAGCRHFHLASRDQDNLRTLASDLRLRFQAEVETSFFDGLDYSSHPQWLKRLSPRPTCVVAAFGFLGDQRKAEHDFEHARKIIESNFLGVVSILSPLADEFEERGSGTVIAVSSVAGERGRAANYVYGASKSALSTYLSGLRNRTSGKGVQVITVLPGFIDTKMTRGMDLPSFLTATPEQVASDICRAWRKGRSIVYSKGVWRIIMWLIRLLPEVIFKRFKF